CFSWRWPLWPATFLRGAPRVSTRSSRCAMNSYCSGRSSDRPVWREMIMRQLRVWFVRFGGLFRKERREKELTGEMDSHLQMQIEDNLRAGMPPTEARHQALIKLGGIEQTREMVRDRRGLPFLETLLQDVRYGA